MLRKHVSAFSLGHHQVSTWVRGELYSVFTKYHTTNKCTNCMSFILNHFFKTLSLLLHVSIAYRLSSSGSTYSSWLKSRVKNMNFFVIILLWQRILYLCTLFIVQGGKWLIKKKFIFLTRDFRNELYVLPDDDKRYAIETCRSSEKCFKKVI